MIRQIKISCDIILPYKSESYKEPASPFFRLKLNPSCRACQNIGSQLPPKKTIFFFRDKFYVGQTGRKSPLESRKHSRGSRLEKPQ